MFCHQKLFVTRSLLVWVWVWGWTWPRSGPGSRSWLWPRTKIYELDIIYLEIKFDQLYALNEASWMISSLKSKLGTCWTEENFLPDVGDLQDLKSTVCWRQRPLKRIKLNRTSECELHMKLHCVWRAVIMIGSKLASHRVRSIWQDQSNQISYSIYPPRPW